MSKSYKIIVKGKEARIPSYIGKEIEKCEYRYTKNNPYIGLGLSRETKPGKEYTGFEGDLAEFNDMFMKDFHYAPNAIQKMGLGLDEILSASINFSRKNYADYFPENKFPDDVKLVGNTIKSKRLSDYISKFLEKGIRLLLQNNGQEFLDEYYSYIDKIYNFRIPLNQIVSKGKVKKSIKAYIEDCNTITKAGRPKSRQAWMELAIRDNVNVNLGDTLYYINTGKSKSQADVKKVTHYYEKNNNDMFGGLVDARVKLEKEYKQSPLGKLAKAENRPSFKEYVEKYHKEIIIEDEIILNCSLVPREIIESENDIFCDESNEYNVSKYIEQFNKRITPLLVCFSPDIRNKILITNPLDKPYFTAEECKLTSGHPNKPGDQDTYEQLMTMEDKEIAFWKKHPEWKIPFLKECGMDWDEIVKDYDERMERDKQLGIDKIKEQFNSIVYNLSSDEIEKFMDGEVPDSLMKIIDVDPVTGNFVAKEYNDIVIGTICDIFDAIENRRVNIENEFTE